MKYSLFILALFLGIISCKEDEPIETLPTMSISDVTFFEGDGTRSFEFKVNLTKGFSEAISVDYSTTGTSATAGEDFIASSGTVNLAANETVQSIFIDIVTDTLKESDEIFQVTISNPVNVVLDKTVGIGTIKNDDTFVLITEDGYTTPESYDGMTLFWADEFNGTAVDLSSWTYEIGNGCPSLCGWGNQELEYYTDSPSNSYLTQGKLVIEAKQENVGGSSYTSARMITRDKRKFKYGRVDIRAILPKGQGLWPALWMMPNDDVFGGWPASGEIDIMELIGHDAQKVHGTVHYDQNGGGHQFAGGSYFNTTGDFSGEFHVFSLVWEEDLIKWYVDDEKFYEVTPATLNGANYPYNEDFFFIFNVAVGGQWPGNPDASTVFPQQMIVDYIRVFQ